MNPSKFTYFLLSVCILYGCNRVVVDYEANELLFAGVDMDQVDSIYQKLSIKEQLGMLFIWRPAAQAETLSLLPQRVHNGNISGYLLEDIELSEYNRLDSLVDQYAPLPPFDFSNQSHFFQNQFSDLPKHPNGLSLASISDPKKFKDYFTTRIAPNIVKHNATLQQSFNTNQIAQKDFTAAYFPVPLDQLLTHSNQSLLEDREAGLLAFNGPLDYSCFPKDSMPLVAEKVNCLYSLIQNGLTGLEVSAEILQGDSSGVITPSLVSNYMDREYEFAGLLFSRCNNFDEIERAFLAGVDLYMVRDSLDGHLQRLEGLMEESRVAAGMLALKVKKIIRARLFLAGKNTELLEMPIADDLPNLEEGLITAIEKKAITVVHNPDSLLPLMDLKLRRFKILDIGKIPSRPFRKQIEHYSDVGLTFVKYEDNILTPEAARFRDRPVIVYLNDIDLSRQKYENLRLRIDEILENAPAVVVNIGHPFNLNLLNPKAAFVQAYSNHPEVQKAMAEVIFGGRAAAGLLPLDLSTELLAGGGQTTSPTRLRYGVAEEVGVAGYKLTGIDALVAQMIEKGATPGCQVLVAKNGVVIYNKAFGHVDSAFTQETTVDHIYDLASITKVASTTLSAMRLYENKQLNINNKIGNYLPWAKTSKLKNVRVKDLLTHRSGIQPHMPIVPIVFPKKDQVRPDCNQYTCNEQKGPYQIKVTDNMFLSVDARDTVWQQVEKLKAKRRRFKYSDVNFILLQKIIEEKSKTSLDQYAHKNFYRPLNLRRTLYRPLDKFKPAEIAPSAYDGKWRKRCLRGNVHDEAAALLGGVGGNAGLFSNAEDLAVIGQMLLNRGTYGGIEYFKPETVTYFTRSGHGNHRGLGFDKYNRRNRKSVISSKVSNLSFGHTGFTGGLFWVDPKHDLVIIFNANRIHPKVNNKELFRGKYRRKIQDVVYRAIAEGKKKGVAKTVGYE